MTETPRILLGFLTAHHPSRWWYRVGARGSFLRDSSLDHIFVFGRPPIPNWPVERLPDELWADCDDRKEFMIHKTQSLCRYALDNGYDFCFRCCDDTLVHVDRLLKADLTSYDYGGQMPCKISIGGVVKIWMRYFDYMHGGTGIWLSRKAMQMIVDAEFDSMICDMPKVVDIGFGLKGAGHTIWWDDLAIGEILKGRLPWDSPLRAVPADAYAANGIQIFEDELVFLNPDPSRAISEHDPGIVKPSSQWITDLMEQVKLLNKGQRAQEVPSGD